MQIILFSNNNQSFFSLEMGGGGGVRGFIKSHEMFVLPQKEILVW